MPFFERQRKTHSHQTEHHLTVDVRRGTPVLLEDTTKDDGELQAEGSGKLGVRSGVAGLGRLAVTLLRLDGASFGFKTTEFVLDGSAFG